MQLFWIHWLALTVFLVKFLQLFIYLQIETILLLPSQCWCLLSFSCLIVLRVHALWNRIGESGHHGLVSNLRGKVFSLSPMSMILAVACYISPLVSWSIFPLYLICSEFLTWIDVNEFCQMLFLHLLRLSFDFSFILLMWYIILIDLHVLNHPCNLFESNLIMVYSPLHVLLDLVCWCFIEDFCIYIHEDMVL